MQHLRSLFGGLTVGIIASFFLLTSPAFADTTATFYSLPADGWMRTAPNGYNTTTWEAQHADTTGVELDYTSDLSLTSLILLKNPSGGGTGTMGFARSFLGFDTSSLPDDAVITSVKLYVYPKYVFGSFNDAYHWLNVYEGRQASTTVLANSDIDDCGDAITHPTKGSSDKGIAGLSANVYTTFSLNATGQGWVSKTGATKLCLREGHDAANYEVFDEGASDWLKSGIYYATFEGGTSTAPYLEVTYVSNNPPVLTPIGNKTVAEGQTLTFTLSATDPNSGDVLTYSATNLPSGATFDPQTRTFSWTPTYAQSGNYENIEFTVMDNGEPMELDAELITITVGDVNRPPVFTPVVPQSVLEGNNLSFTVAATDPDDNIFTLSASGTPAGATFNPETGVFSWTPTTAQAGNYTVTFTATDNGIPVENGTLDVVITVGDNPTPIEEADIIVDVVVDANLDSNIENSYLANLQKVKVFIEQGKVGPAINQLDAFIQKVNQDYAHGDITQGQRDTFLALANDLKGDLE